MSFQCVIVTPEQQVMDDQIEQAIVPAHDGLLGILTGRAPLLVKLGMGPLRIDSLGGSKQYYFIDGGVAQMKDNKLTILTNEATEASEIDAEAARAEYAEAAARRATDIATAETREKEMNKAKEKQHVAAMR